MVKCQYVRTRIYVDAFNLYYGALRNTPYKWLDIDALCRKLLNTSNSIEHIHYFTAPVSARPTDLGQPQRQQLYLRALRTLPHLTITNGRFLSRPVRMPAANPRPGQPKTVEVTKTEEKSSVNFYKRIRKGVLSASQFPTTMTDIHGTFTEPPGW